MSLFGRRFRLGGLLRDRRGNVLMLMAFGLPIVVGAAGLGVHSVELTLVKRQLQRQADSAALAGAYSLYQNKGNAAAIAQANSALADNVMVTGATPTITPGSYTSGGTTYTSTMFVRLTSIRPTLLMAMFGIDSKTIGAEARAAVVPDGKLCFIALERGNTAGVKFAGNSNLNLGCGVGTNSVAGIAVDVNGQPTVNASPVVARGGVPPSAAYSAGTVLMSNHAELTDPFAGNSYDPAPNVLPPCKNGNVWKVIDVPSGVTETGSPGCYGTINVQGTLTLSSGTYFLGNGANNAGLQIGAQGHLICDKCTFVLTSTTPNNASSFATMNINGGAEVDITAADSGVYNGITIYRDSRAAATNQCCTINGNSNSTISGAFYFPKDVLTFNGTSGMTLNCFQMVALQLAFSGNASITNTCTPLGGIEKWALNVVRLIS